MCACCVCGENSLVCQRADHTSAVHGPLTKPGLSTFCHRCRHCTSVRPGRHCAIFFQHFPSYFITALRRISSCAPNAATSLHGRQHRPYTNTSGVATAPHNPASACDSTSSSTLHDRTTQDSRETAVAPLAPPGVDVGRLYKHTHKNTRNSQHTRTNGSSCPPAPSQRNQQRHYHTRVAPLHWSSYRGSYREAWTWAGRERPVAQRRRPFR